MPMKTRPLPPQPAPSPLASRAETAAAVLALAAAAALLELLAGLFLGAFPLTHRAEAFLFLLYRPWVVLLLALAVARFGWRRRAASYLAFLLLAGLGEALYMLRLGNPAPGAEMLRGWAAGAAIALAADAALGLAGRRGRRWTAAAAGALALVLALPPVRGGYEQVIAAPAQPAPAGPRPDVLLMTALPLVWGEGGAFDPASRPAAIYTALQQEFALRPIDALDEASLGRARLLLLIQPRWLAPEELVALDAWVRRGGRALVLTDPKLGWHSDLPLGDIRRPPPTGLLGPLLDHWGLALEPGGRLEHGGRFDRGRWLVTEYAGRLTARSNGCRLIRAYLAECRLGEGRALVVVDAGLVRDDLWVGEGPSGASCQRRLSDNPLVVADLLDRLAGMERARALGDARWADGKMRNNAALLRALLPLLGLAVAAALAALLLRRRRTR